ncbi:MAG: hypothetical protein A3G88_04505 [Omnitrophica WOR_2 bacterium RIFCSPLOWO2_12_FULL_63_16]|nr:MAG: hypothetical protein A3G88_04505 [Omnitrophica WOR_2 bacterium RIFCSPLOWO2_12_FULL_63_16]
MRSTPIRRWHEMTTALQLLVAAPEQAARAARTVAGCAFDWCYFGTDLSRQAAVAAVLPGAHWIRVGDALTRVATEMKQPFLDWIDTIGRQQGNPVNWWASAFASSNPLESDLFLLVCYTRLVQEWLDADREGPRRLVIVEDPWLALTLRRHLARHPRVTWCGGSLGACLQDAIFWLAKVPRVMGATLLSAIRSFLIVKRVFRHAAHDFDGVPQPLTLIYTWIEPRSFLTPGTLTDGWAGRLKELLSRQGACVKRFTPASVPPSLLPRLQPLAEECVVTPRHLPLFQIVRAVCGWHRLQRLPLIARCRGWDYRWLLSREQLREWGQADFGYYRLGYVAMRELARRHGHRVQTIIYPFENRPWEKLLCLAWRTAAPHVRLIGYQHVWVPSLLLPYSLATGQSERAPLPDLIVANSAFNLARLLEGGYPASRLVNGGALQYEYLHAASWRAASNAAPAAQTGRTARTALVTFPVSRAHAWSLFAALVSEFRHPLLVDGEPVRFVLKCHPALPMERLSQDPVTLPPGMALSQAPLRQLLPSVDLLLYVGPTSSWWEARLHGVPVLKYQTDLLDMDAGHGIDGFSVQYCCRATLRASIEACLSEVVEKRPLPEHVVRRLFDRVDEQLWVTLTG